MLGHTQDQIEHNCAAHRLFSHSQGFTGSLTHIIPTHGSPVLCPVTPGSRGSDGPSSCWVLNPAFFLVVGAWRHLLLYPQFMIQPSLPTSPHSAPPILLMPRGAGRETGTAVPRQHLFDLPSALAGLHFHCVTSVDIIANVCFCHAPPGGAFAGDVGSLWARGRHLYPRVAHIYGLTL